MDKLYQDGTKCPQIENLEKITPEQAAEYVRFVAHVRHTQRRYFTFRKPADGGIPYIEIKRAKYKHWHIIGFHFESNQAFKRALVAGTVVWLPKIIEPPTLFEK